MKIFISGKIGTGSIEHAINKFKLAKEKALKLPGITSAVCPFIDVDYSDRNRTWQDYMKNDLKALIDCDAIYLQCDWQESRGSKIEKELAENLGLTIFFEKFPI